MPTSFTRRLALSLTTVSKLAAIAAILMVGIFIAAKDTQHTDASFTPGYTFVYSTTGTSDNADLLTVLTIGAPSINFGSVVTNTPGTTVAGPSNCNDAGGVGSYDAACGEIGGELISTATLGIGNGICATAVPVAFVMFEATTDITDTITPVAQGITGSLGVLENMLTDDGDAPGANNSGGIGSSGANVDGIPAHVNQYPDYLNTIFTPDGGSAVTPLNRLSGATIVAG